MVLVAGAIALGGCAGKVDYVKPTAKPSAGANSKTINRSRDAVWNSSVPELGKQFFVINNLDKASGLMNISYSGSPEKYIDCGVITSYVKNVRGERTYTFPGASPQQNYEVMTKEALLVVDRRMALEGRVNLIFEEIGANQTKVTANTRYVITKTAAVHNVQGHLLNRQTDTISFNSGGTAAFPGQSSECTSTGTLEADILSAVR